jgi:hypothetical protein
MERFAADVIPRVEAMRTLGIPETARSDAS